MTKFKYDIVKNNLSWEKYNLKMCDKVSCKNEGSHKAPKSRSNLSEYYYFCLKHVSEYNKSWDFYRGLSVDQIELSMRKDTVWDRPSWPLKGNPHKVIEQLKEFLSKDYSLFEKEREIRDFLNNKKIDETLTAKENDSLKKLGLKIPITVNEIKKKYKKLVKIFHPDVNANNKEAEKKFREITESYKILLKKFLKNES
tara:strand:+ start:190 stop:783 length:594 start_codon:yes stop_codon:yes gene_type:complete